MDLRLRWIAAGWESVTAVQRIKVDEPSNCEGLRPPRVASVHKLSIFSWSVLYTVVGIVVFYDST